jgi:hypothetical protein
MLAPHARAGVLAGYSRFITFSTSLFPTAMCPATPPSSDPSSLVTAPPWSHTGKRDLFFLILSAIFHRD